MIFDLKIFNLNFTFDVDIMKWRFSEPIIDFSITSKFLDKLVKVV